MSKMEIQLNKLLKYDLTKAIGHKTVETGGKTLVNYVRCKVCAEFKTQVEGLLSIKGSAKTSGLAFINITKHQV